MTDDRIARARAAKACKQCEGKSRSALYSAHSYYCNGCCANVLEAAAPVDGAQYALQCVRARRQLPNLKAAAVSVLDDLEVELLGYIERGGPLRSELAAAAPVAVEQAPKCAGEWLSGSGGHRVHAPGSCSKVSTWWHPDDMFGYCDAHIVEHDKECYDPSTRRTTPVADAAMVERCGQALFLDGVNLAPWGVLTGLQCMDAARVVLVAAGFRLEGE